MKHNKGRARRNKRAKAVRRLRGVLEAQSIVIRSLQARIQGLTGTVRDIASEHADLERHSASFLEKLSITNATVGQLQHRIGCLERVPRFIRVLFGAG